MAWSNTSRHERGYGTEWDKLRKIILRRDNGLCQTCAKAGLITAATHVDHIKSKSKGGADAESNLQSLCKDCHDAKTITDEGKAPRRKAAIGIDGWPK